MKMLQEFKSFAMRGNVVDMAVGIVIGASFNKIVSALVEKVITPITAYLTGNTDVSGMSIPLPSIAGKEAATIGWGAVAQAILDFVIVALALFIVVRVMNRLREKEEAGPPKTPEEVILLREIRDQLARSP